MLADAWLPRAAAARPEHPATATLTYGALLERACAAAGALRARGVGPGDRVAPALPAGDELLVALHAAWLLGAAVAVGGAGAHEVREVGEAAPITAPSHHDLDAVALVVRTSGTSSGVPKEVPLTFGNLLWSAQGAHVALGVRPDDVWLCCLPLTHVGGLSILSRSAAWGTTALLHDGFDLDRVLEDLGRATIVSLVPTTLRRLLDAGVQAPPGLRHVVVGGAAADPSLLGRARERGLPVVTTYGMTETASMVVVDGRPVFCARLATGPGGELVVRGPMVSGGEHRTGDRGELAPDGTLRVLGRLDDVIITGGENVSPDAVEAALAAHPAVAEAAVVGRPHPEWGQAVTAVVVPRAPVGPDELRAWCAARLARHEVPKTYELRDALPRNEGGKVLRRELR